MLDFSCVSEKARFYASDSSVQDVFASLDSSQQGHLGLVGIGENGYEGTSNGD
jgi:hypothetical protein